MNHLPDKQDRKRASEIASVLNDMSFNPEKVAEAFTLEHRTLQQTLTRFAYNWLVQCASDDYLFDDRNAASHIFAKALLEGKTDLPALPFI